VPDPDLADHDDVDSGGGEFGAVMLAGGAQGVDVSVQDEGRQQASEVVTAGKGLVRCTLMPMSGPDATRRCGLAG
jgi:hypothetical protein